MPEKRKWKIGRSVLVAAASLLMAGGVFLAFVLSRPSVAFASPALPEGFSFPDAPPRLSPSYRITGDPSHSDLAIIMPSEPVPETEGMAVLFGRSAEEGEDPDLVLIPDPTAMWESALSDRKECILYESSDRIASEIADHLLSIDGNAYEVTYPGRISAANLAEMAALAAGSDIVLALSPSSSLRLIREGDIPPVIVDAAHAAALESTEIQGSAGIDWDSTIKGLLSGEGSLHYALFLSED